MQLQSEVEAIVSSCFAQILAELEMWANAQPDGRPVEYR